MYTRRLKSGYTTGTCAQAAACAAAKMLLSSLYNEKTKEIKKIEVIDIMLPNGQHLNLPITDICFEKGKSVSCAVKKDSGDDPDVTNGVKVYSKVSFSKNQTITLMGGIGIGTVTKPGLEQPVGSPAINKVPRRVIVEAVQEACEEYGYEGGLKIVVSIPEGERIAKKTFNARLGIEGGLSVLGTSGVVEPMSEKALVDTIKVEIDVKLANEGSIILAAPGNYGMDFLKENYGMEPKRAIKCSNFVGETIDMAMEAGAEGLLFIAHIGKFVKVAGGIMNTHSKYGDCRMEILAAAALRVGLRGELAKEMLTCITTDEALSKCSETERGKVVQEILRQIQQNLTQRSNGRLKTGAAIFSNVYGFLGMTEVAPQLLENIKM